MKTRLLAVLAALALAAGGFGIAQLTHSSSSVPSPGTALVVPLPHACTKANFYMQCALGAPQNSLTPNTATGAIQGIDTFGPATCTLLDEVGAHFDASYFSHDPAKDWTLAAVNALHRCGKATVGVWETAATEAQAGFNAGVADAKAARAEAAAVGNTTRPIDFAVDCQCAPSSVLAYFRGVHSVLGSRDDAYADYAVINYLHAHGVVGNENWQTYAWSAGQWLPSSVAPLEQYLNGQAYDHDRALTGNYGQWPYTATPAVAAPCFGKGAQPTSTRCAPVVALYDKRAAELRATETALRSARDGLVLNGCVRPYRRDVCFDYVATIRTLQARALWFVAQQAKTVKVYSG